MSKTSVNLFGARQGRGDKPASSRQLSRSVEGRLLNADDISIESLLAVLSKPKIWDVEGRVQGMELGNSRCQFDFNYEDDLRKVLNKRPCHFNYWSFRAETSCWWYFSKYHELWISVKGIPTHFWLNEIYEEIGRKLGAVGAIDDLLGDDEELILVDLKYFDPATGTDRWRCEQNPSGWQKR